MLDLKRQARLQEIWEHIARLGITEQDIADAVAWARANPGAKKVNRDISALADQNMPRK
jgi:hypothetical protein